MSYPDHTELPVLLAEGQCFCVESLEGVELCVNYPDSIQLRLQPSKEIQPVVTGTWSVGLLPDVLLDLIVDEGLELVECDLLRASIRTLGSVN